jgi:ParB-like chromosome segregation protein Spo0J
VRPTEDQAKNVHLRVAEIETLPAIFQPREVGLGNREGKTDKRYVGRLQQRMSNVGELDPVTVIKLGEAWVIVDGHHRLEAYRKKKWEKPIRCKWFEGSVREAMDASMRRNVALKLEMSLADRQEEAWKRVLMGGWTREQIRKTCSVGPKLITLMKKVVTRYRDKKDRRKRTREFRKEVGILKESSWRNARLAYINAEAPQARTLEERAQTLARLMRERLTNKLSEDPEVTARAVAIYDRGLPKRLIGSWERAPNDDEDFDYVIDGKGGWEERANGVAGL